MGANFLQVTSLSNWQWGETGMVALLVILAALTMRSVAQRDRAIIIGKAAEDESKRAAYEARWRSGGMAGA